MLGTGTGLVVGFAHAHSVSPFTWFRLNQLTHFRMQEETLEIAMRGWHRRRRPPPHWMSTPRLRRHMSVAHDRRTANMPSWCSRLMRPVYGGGSSARRMPDSTMLASISSSTTGTISGHHPNSDFLLRTAFSWCTQTELCTIVVIQA
jgi:hypothetical protein